MMKKFTFLLILLIGGALSMQAMVLSGKKVTATATAADQLDYSTPYNLFTSIKNKLEAKQAQEELSTVEQRMLRKVDRRIAKWDKKNERLVAKGKKPRGGKSWIAAVLICIFFGLLGIHRFYLGYTWQGFFQLFTAGGFVIWALVDLIRLIVRDLRPKNGFYTD